MSGTRDGSASLVVSRKHSDDSPKSRALGQHLARRYRLHPARHWGVFYASPWARQEGGPVLLLCVAPRPAQWPARCGWHSLLCVNEKDCRSRSRLCRGVNGGRGKEKPTNGHPSCAVQRFQKCCPHRHRSRDEATEALVTPDPLPQMHYGYRTRMLGRRLRQQQENLSAVKMTRRDLRMARSHAVTLGTCVW